MASVSAGNNKEIGGMIAKAMERVGRQGVVTMEESRTAEDNLYVVEGMQVPFPPRSLLQVFLFNVSHAAIQYHPKHTCSQRIQVFKPLLLM